MDPKREALLAAVNALATCDSPSREYERLQDAAPLAKRINALLHDFEVLRPLVELASRDAALRAARETVGSRLSKEQMRETLSAFWATIDRELDELEEVARAEMLNPSRKNKPRHCTGANSATDGGEEDCVTSPDRTTEGVR